MYITNLDEVVAALRPKLKEYLVLKKGIRANARKINCFVHEEHDPSMYFNPKTNDETVKCFGCLWSGDIFGAASAIENLPTNGEGWIKETVPHLAKLLDVPISLGEPTPEESEKAKFFKLTRDITDIALSNDDLESNAIKYADNRGWVQESLPIFSIEDDVLISRLVGMGWDAAELNRTLLIRSKYNSFFGLDKVTFVIEDHRARPVGFISRNIHEDATSKYINTQENVIFEKGKHLLGLPTALKEAKKYGLYIVEGPGDLAHLRRLGIINSVAVCSTALTEHHLLLLKQLGIRRIYLSFDWDNPGLIATQRVLEGVLGVASGIATYIVLSPQESFEDFKDNPKDPDEYLCKIKDPQAYLDLKKVSAFEWRLGQASEHDAPDVICTRMVPIIASEEAAVKRELLISTLSQFTGISASAILSDVNSLRDDKFNERIEKLSTAAKQYVAEVEEAPDNIMTHMAKHELEVEKIEKEYKKDTVGVNYQLARWDAVQEHRSRQKDNPDASSFKMNYFTAFHNAMAGGMNWANGCLMYMGGRSNSGKTATVITIGVDVAMSDPDALVILHSTDDSYEQLEPRIKTNVWRMTSGLEEHPLTIGMMVQPHLYLTPKPQAFHKAYAEVNDIFRDLLNQERLVVVDSEDGSTLTTLERNVRYYRARYPSKKIMLVCDNTHNYMDYSHLDSTARMTLISNRQKSLTAKYHACMIATAEYRKNMPQDPSKLKWPVDDDLADARALMYRPNVILHVYNDMNDREEYAEIFWQDEKEEIHPRLLLNFTKNKISTFKEKLVLDLDEKTVTLKPKSSSKALEEAEAFKEAKESKTVKVSGTKVVAIEASEFKEEK